MNPMSKHHPLGDATVYHLTSYLLNVMFLFLVNTVKFDTWLVQTLTCRFCILGECQKYMQNVS